MMRTYSRLLTTLAAGVLAIAFAQGPQSGPGKGARAGNGGGQPRIDVAQMTVIQGEVVQVNISPGVQYPSIVVRDEALGKDVAIEVAPVWFLLENDFEIEKGDEVSVAAAPSTSLGDLYLHAISIRDLLTGDEIVLRDSSGRPLWMAAQRRGATAPDPRAASTRYSGCLDSATIQTITGTVEQIVVEAGIRHPLLVVNVDGQLVSVKVGPARVLLAADFQLAAGDPVTVKFAVAACTNELVALDLTDEFGNTVQLRDDSGRRVW